ncbi:hypothetical protein VIGAN_10112500 [Vigna angularis var. angularis]|uniref:Uncharacterized protein n=1 Tax=Vigna angularis var. angularis TaxID=157739 RepID=A0A0S3T3N0_PHAAN|nr:hypothetical protein VIGAN_10112500 [Vigna angularis var. angularis]
MLYNHKKGELPFLFPISFLTPKFYFRFVSLSPNSSIYTTTPSLGVSHSFIPNDHGMLFSLIHLTTLLFVTFSLGVSHSFIPNDHGMLFSLIHLTTLLFVTLGF